VATFKWPTEDICFSVLDAAENLGVIGWPQLDTRSPPKLLYHSSPQLYRREKI